ncbi:uncharacterized protein LOC115012044 [Cottoperca gobio]|uniref:Uncharacterized protein LOC115012044 n=1 Tax=Cottoperca gobio TaxID=56716 RepID=A0A6J2Q6M4_COTGO|nr:uncharacterized protein LOC115012044 [Cottoperca gobio]
MASTSTDKRFRIRHKPKRSDPPNNECGKGIIQHVTAGPFHLTAELETNPIGYQSDSASVQAQGGQEGIRGQWLSISEESWQRLQPVVDCRDDAMTLTVRRRRAVQLQLGRVNESPVPLSQLPPQCGYSVLTTWRDLSLTARYDACHVTQKDDRYVLPLMWRGTPVEMSCKASRIQIQPQAVSPSSLCCSPYGMTVKLQGLYATEDLRVNVRGEWTPLVELAEQCGYTLDRRDAEIVIAAPFITCGITVKDGKYTLSLQMGEKTFTLACPVSPPEELTLTHQPLGNSPHLTSGPTEDMPESLEPFPWAPPFFLAPPYYPHPTYHNKYPDPDGHDAYNPLTPSSPTPEPTFGPQPLPPVVSRPDYQDYPHQIPVHLGGHTSLASSDDVADSSQVNPDGQQKHKTPVLGSMKLRAAHSPSSDTGFQIQVEAPPLQPPSHMFNPYYHYYHHPKIPLTGHGPDPGAEVTRDLSFTNHHIPEFPEWPPDVQQSEALSRVTSHQVSQPVPEGASPLSSLPASPPQTSAPDAPPPPQPYPYHYYFPHIARVGAKRLPPLNPETPPNMSNDQNANSGNSDHPLPHSAQVHDKYNLNPYIDLQNLDTIINFQKSSPELIKLPLTKDDDDDVFKAELFYGRRHSSSATPAVQPPLPPSYPPGPDTVAFEQLSFPTPSPHHNLPSYPYYYHPYYHYYQMYYGPESLLNPASPTSSKEALDSLLQASSSPPQHPSYRIHQTTPAPTKLVYNGPLNPLQYYYHLYYQPKVSANNQELHPAGSLNSEKASESQLPSDHSGLDWLVHAAEAGYPSIPQPLHNLNSHYITQKQPYDALGHPAGEEAEERLDSEMKDHLNANPSTPSASPCGLGPVSGLGSQGCCSYPVKDCTMGQHLIFAVPDSVGEPTVAPAARPSEVSNVSCTLQKLTSDPDIYMIPLDGCGVSRHVFGETVVHLVEVHGIHYLQQDHSSVIEISPVRLMVECSSSPGSPGEVRLHVMAPPPPPPVQSTPATVTVQLRVATDESFTSFHPKAHLPLSLVRGRAVYVQLSLLDAPEPGLLLLVHSCLAYTHAPYTSWMPVYDGCPGRSDSQLLSSPRSDPHHIQRIVISGFQALPSESPSYMAEGGYPHLEDPEIFFMCLTEVCYAADGDCTVSCINSPTSDV